MSLGGPLGGVQVFESAYVTPTELDRARVDARRIVRHGMADVLAWLGEPVGPKPGEPFDVMYVFGGGSMVYAAPSTIDAIRVRYGREAQTHTSAMGKVHPGPRDLCVSLYCDPAVRGCA